LTADNSVFQYSNANDMHVTQDLNSFGEIIAHAQCSVDEKKNIYIPCTIFAFHITLKELLLFQTIFRLCFEAITTNEENYITYGNDMHVTQHLNSFGEIIAHAQCSVDEKKYIYIPCVPHKNNCPKKIG
jgi:formylmethanofuran dehydrogenase subunit D